MRVSIPLVLLASAAVVAVPAQVPTLTGRWQVQTRMAGNESAQECTFVQKDGDFTGSCGSGQTAVEISGQVDGTRVTFSYKADYQGTALTMAYTGTLESATRMAGTVSLSPFGMEGSFSATQSSPEPPPAPAPATQAAAAQAAASPAKTPAGVPAPAAPAARPANTDESLVGSYVLPDPLVCLDGTRVKDAKTWNAKRRPEILELAEEHQYGRMPGRPKDMTFEVFDKGTAALNGKAVRKQVTIYFSANKAGPKADLLIYLPAAAAKPAPVLLNLSFSPNVMTVSDPGVRAGEMWGKDKKRIPVPAGSPGMGRTNVEQFLDRGFGFATMYYGDIDPDFDGGATLGVRGLYLKPGQAEPGPDEWGAISAWAWGMSRAMDYLERDPGVDARRVAIFGVSRLGKTVVWAGAHDTRFALVIASASGEGGAALSRRDYGETVKNLNANFPYQFCANYRKYGDRVDDLPIDSHMLLALIAPRPVLLQTGDGDKWSDPKGEFLAAVAAEPVYRLLGRRGLGTDEWPPAGTPLLSDIGYFMHAGGHGPLPSDYAVFLDFMDTHLRPRK